MPSKPSSSQEFSDKDLALLFEVGSLRNISRGWTHTIGVKMANDPEHIFRVQFIALMLARAEGGADEGLILKMALVHDLAESRTLDHAHVHRAYIEMDEEKAVEHTLSGTLLANLRETVALYSQRDTLEAKIVKDADNLDADFELKELENRGHKVAAKWQKNRHNIRNTKFYTDSARKMWDLLQHADPDAWHLQADKWMQNSHAGK